jgi:hypothetical protein
VLPRDKRSRWRDGRSGESPDDHSDCRRLCGADARSGGCLRCGAPYRLSRRHSSGAAGRRFNVRQLPHANSGTPAHHPSRQRILLGGKYWDQGTVLHGGARRTLHRQGSQATRLPRQEECSGNRRPDISATADLPERQRLIPAEHTLWRRRRPGSGWLTRSDARTTAQPQHVHSDAETDDLRGRHFLRRGA